MLAYQGDAEDHGAMIAFLTPVEGGTVADDGVILDVGGAEPMRLKCRTVVNSAGLFAPALAHKLQGFPKDKIPQARFAKGNYYDIEARIWPTHRCTCACTCCMHMHMHTWLLGQHSMITPVHAHR